MTPDSDSKKLFIAGLSESITERRLREWLEGAGLRVARLGVPLDRATGRPRGFAFVTLDSEADALKARQNLDSTRLDGREVSVREFRSESLSRNGPPRPLSRPPGGGDESPPPSPRVGNLPPRTGAYPRAGAEEAPRASATVPQNRATWDEPRRVEVAKKEKKEKRKKVKGVAERVHQRRTSEGFNLRSRRALDDFDDEADE